MCGSSPMRQIKELDCTLGGSASSSIRSYSNDESLGRDAESTTRDCISRRILKSIIIQHTPSYEYTTFLSSFILPWSQSLLDVIH